MTLHRIKDSYIEDLVLMNFAVLFLINVVCLVVNWSVFILQHGDGDGSSSSQYGTAKDNTQINPYATYSDAVSPSVRKSVASLSLV